MEELQAALLESVLLRTLDLDENAVGHAAVSRVDACIGEVGRRLKRRAHDPGTRIAQPLRQVALAGLLATTERTDILAAHTSDGAGPHLGG